MSLEKLLVLAWATGGVACVTTTQVPVRACILEGADLAREPARRVGPPGQWSGPVASAEAHAQLVRQLGDATVRVWATRATVSFPLARRADGTDAIPIVALRYSTDGRTAGTIRVAGLKNELTDAIASCREAWAPLDAGVVVVWARDFVTDDGRAPAPDSGITRGLGSAVPSSREDALCIDPGSVTADELAAVGVAIAEPLRFGGGATHRDGEPVLVLAHELGHALLLGHGDGVDNDGNGRWDHICDPGEDADAKPYTLMTQASSADALSPAQIAWARAVAARYRGAIVPPQP